MIINQNVDTFSDDKGKGKWRGKGNGDDSDCDELGNFVIPSNLRNVNLSMKIELIWIYIVILKMDLLCKI